MASGPERHLQVASADPEVILRVVPVEPLPGPWPVLLRHGNACGQAGVQGPSGEGFNGYDPEDRLWVSAGDLQMTFSARGHLSISANSLHRPPSADCALFEVADVLLPLYVALIAVSSGACDRLFGTRRGRLRYGWEMEIEERIAFPTPLAHAGPVGFPGRVPTSIPLGGRWREPSQIHFRGWNLSRLQCKPDKVLGTVLSELLALWGFESDPVVMAEVRSRLRSMRVTQSVGGLP